MNKSLPIIFYGATAILAGILLLFLNLLSLDTIRFSIGISLTCGAIYAFVSANKSPKQNVRFVYHEIHAIAMMVYGISLMVFGSSLASLIFITAFLFLFYAFTEFIFCLQVFDLRKKFSYRIIITPALTGVLVGVGTILALNFPDYTIRGFSLIFMLVGVSVLLYKPVIKISKIYDLDPV